MIAVFQADKVEADAWGCDWLFHKPQPHNPFHNTDKAQQLIDQYGTEEGLRRLKKSDPEEARRFERERRGAPSGDVSSGHTHPDDAL